VLVQLGDHGGVGDGLTPDEEVAGLGIDEHRRAFACVGFGVAADEVDHGNLQEIRKYMVCFRKSLAAR
jgi:hypothetical protein